MRKCNKAVIIIAAAVGALAIITLGMLIWFFSPGAHRLFGFTNLNTDQTGYLVNQERQIVGEATFSAKGCAPSATEHGVTAKKNAFSHIQIGDFPSITSDENASAYTRELDDDILMITVSTSSPETEALLYYRVFIDMETNEILMGSFETIQSEETVRHYFFTTDDMDVINSTLDRCPY